MFNRSSPLNVSVCASSPESVCSAALHFFCLFLEVRGQQLNSAVVTVTGLCLCFRGKIDLDARERKYVEMCVNAVGYTVDEERLVHN